MTTAKTRLAVQGAGMIGRRHIASILAEPMAALAAIIDPNPATQSLAAESGCGWYPDFAAMLAATRPDGVIVATPTALHVQHGLDAVAAGVPMLMEKPLADDVAGAAALVAAAERAGVPLLVGHHRRHNPLIQVAKRAIDAGRIGAVVAVQGTCWFRKDDAYFDVAWHREKGAGPVLTNLIHDVDLLRYLCGEVQAVQAMLSHAQRNFVIEDSGVILLRFKSGALATVAVSDAIASPWSWEFTSGENPAHTQTREACFLIGGTTGSLSVPHLALWAHTTTPSWWEPLASEKLPAEPGDPYRLQVRNLCGVIRGTETAVVSGHEGLATLRVIAAVQEAARTGGTVQLG